MNQPKDTYHTVVPYCFLAAPPRPATEFRDPAGMFSRIPELRGCCGLGGGVGGKVSACHPAAEQDALETRCLRLQSDSMTRPPVKKPPRSWVENLPFSAFSIFFNINKPHDIFGYMFV